MGRMAIRYCGFLRATREKTRAIIGLPQRQMGIREILLGLAWVICCGSSPVPPMAGSESPRNHDGSDVHESLRSGFVGKLEVGQGSWMFCCFATLRFLS